MKFLHENLLLFPAPMTSFVSPFFQNILVRDFMHRRRAPLSVPGWGEK
jgi:hypothetical protein